MFHRDITENNIRQVFLETLSDCFNLAHYVNMHKSNDFATRKHVPPSQSIGSHIFNGANPFYAILIIDERIKPYRIEVPENYVINFYYAESLLANCQFSDSPDPGEPITIDDVTYVRAGYEQVHIPLAKYIEIHGHKYPTALNQLFLTVTNPTVHIPISTKFDPTKLAKRVHKLTTSILKDYRLILGNLGHCLLAGQLFTIVTNKLLNSVSDVLLSGTINLNKTSMSNRKTIYPVVGYQDSGVASRVVDLLESLTFSPYLAEQAVLRVFPNFSPEATNSNKKAKDFNYSTDEFRFWYNTFHLTASMDIRRGPVQTHDRLCEDFEYHRIFKEIIRKLNYQYNGWGRVVQNVFNPTSLEQDIATSKQLGPLVAHWFHAVVALTDIIWKELFEDLPMAAEHSHKSLDELKHLSIDEFVTTFRTKMVVPRSNSMTPISDRLNSVLSMPALPIHSNTSNLSERLHSGNFPSSAKRPAKTMSVCNSKTNLATNIRNMHKLLGEEHLCTFYSIVLDMNYRELSYITAINNFLQPAGFCTRETRLSKYIEAHNDDKILRSSDFVLQRGLLRLWHCLLVSCNFLVMRGLDEVRLTRRLIQDADSYINIKHFKSPKSRDVYSTHEGTKTRLKTHLV